MRIFVVDDDPVFLELCSGMLRALGHGDVETADCAESALGRAEEALLPFECLLIDIRMPGRDGIAFTRALRGIPRYARTPILVVTAKGDERTVEAAFAAGATDFLEKPLDAEQLRARLDAAATILGQRDRLGALGAVLGPPLDNDGFAFDDAVSLQPMDAMVDHVALSNMVQTKMRMRAFDATVLALRIENAAALFAAMPTEDYADLLSDIAAIAIDGLRPLQPTVAHAGGGDFVAVLHGDLPADMATLEASLAAAAETLQVFFASDGIEAPRLRLGAPVRPGLLSSQSASDLFDRARRSARQRCAA